MIFDEVFFEPTSADPLCLDESFEEPDDVLLWGYDTGLTNLANSKYHMTGTVEEANGDFSALEGRRVYMSGEILWYPTDPPAPHYAPGIIRIN